MAGSIHAALWKTRDLLACSRICQDRVLFDSHKIALWVESLDKKHILWISMHLSHKELNLIKNFTFVSLRHRRWLLASEHSRIPQTKQQWQKLWIFLPVRFSLGASICTFWRVVKFLFAKSNIVDFQLSGSLHLMSPLPSG